jgi:hypothetical protein
LDPEIGHAVENTSQVRLVDDRSSDYFHIPVGTNVDVLDEVSEPTCLSSANNEAVGLGTTHSRIVSGAGASSLARPVDHPGESASSLSSVARSTACFREVESSLR